MIVNKSVTAELTRKIAVIVSLVFLVFVSYFGALSYVQAMQHAKQNIERHANSLGLDIQNVLAKESSVLVGLSDNRVLAELATNILFTQYAFKQLQNLVNDNPLIKAAFISDGSEFLVEGYPVESLKHNDSVIQSLTKSLLNKDGSDNSVQLAFVKQEDAKISYLGGRFYLVVPLRVTIPSLIQPFKNTSALFLSIDPLQLINFSALTDDTNIRLKIGNDIWFERYETGSEDKTLSALSNVFTDEVDKLSMTVELEERDNRYMREVYRSILVSILVILFSFILLVWFIRRLGRRVLAPLKKLEDSSNLLLKGDYQTFKEPFEFIEFNNLQNALNTMAKKVLEQIESSEEAKLKAEKSEQVKAQFLANMSHEIRTPLNGMLGTLQVLQRQRLEPEAKSLVEKGLLSSRTLLTIVNDILDFSKIEAGMLELELLPCDVRSIVKQVISDMEHIANDKGISLVIVCEKEFHPFWVVDPVRFKQVVLNIASNGLKFTESGQVNFILTSAENGFQLTVKDTGIGMDESALRNLFNRFEQADSSTTRKYGGTGLGMAISKQLVELMAGSINVKSAPGQGTEFVLDFKVERSQLGELKKEQAKDSKPPNLSDKVILLAEDNLVNQAIFKAMIEPTNATLHVANDGVEAIAMTQDIEPDIVFMDIQMPNLDGIQACKRLRDQSFVQPIIAVTANSMTQDVEQYLANGFTFHLAKPIDINALYSQLKRV